ncbi:MAG TPA: FtsK/SpoIIIE domain-containing protein, partial [Candidatus Dormibacteraeota bacterium]|nr:FtsK/SpoIIIE domain-containing protein [Candidatus Dormibacteraeota bacterium]
DEQWSAEERLLPVTLGLDLEGRAVIADLAKMPHLLIAGATGTGKSVGINAIITSLIYHYQHKEDLRLLMIDPKMVELSMYKDLPHLRHPVVTNNKEAARVLKWAVGEMERRYALLEANGARNMSDFNRKVVDGKPLKHPAARRVTLTDIAAEAPDTPPPPPELEAYTEGKLPLIVIVVDELADLMMTVQAEVETPLARLAQKARAVGLHLILATQRPSVNVITGLIKANFPSRIAFRVASKVDSRTILDGNGAEALLGKGDMLFLEPGKSEPMRLQGAYISTEESEKIMERYRQWKVEREHRGTVEGAESNILDEVPDGDGGDGGGDGAADAGERDQQFKDAAIACIQNQGGSTSLLQRKLGIGYGRAARIMDQLEEAGILGPANGSKPRDVRIGIDQIDEYCR